MGEDSERGQWTGKLDFLLSCLGYAVGKLKLTKFCWYYGQKSLLLFKWLYINWSWTFNNNDIFKKTMSVLG